MTVAAMVVALLAGGLPASPAVAQDSLEDAARRLADLWAGGDASGLAEMLRPSGVALDLTGRPHASLQVRQAAAALRDLLEGHASQSVRLDRYAEVEGTPPRAFVELAWVTVPEGTAEVMRYTVFAGLERTADGWRITEIRLLR